MTERTFKPMLCAQKATIADIKYPTYVSVKLDGIRCLGMAGRAVSREIIDIPNPYVQEFFSDTSLNGLDGELIVGPANAPDCYKKTFSGTMSEKGDKPTKDFRYFIFDDWTRPNRFFIERIASLQQRWDELCPRFGPAGKLVLLPQVMVNNRDELEKFYIEQLEAGYEGIVTKVPHGIYKFGRSTINENWAMKLKPKAHAEARIIGIYEEEENTNEATTDNLGHTKRSTHAAGKVGKGSLGGYLVEMMETYEDAYCIIHKGTTFNIGGGTLMTAKFRKERWEMHKSGPVDLDRFIRFSFCPIGVDVRPRHPQADGFRSTIDM